MMKRSVLTMAVATLLVAVMAMTAEAQPGRRGGGPGGRGGPGMMMGPGGFGGMSLMMLAQMEAVQKEIEALDDQVEEINALAEEMRSARGPRGGGGERPDFRNMSEEERTKFFAEMREEREKQQAEADKKLGEILIGPQMARLGEIRIQAMGMRALMDEEIATKLKITEQQKEKMEKVREEAGQKMRELFQGGGQENIDRDAMREKMTEMRESIEKEILEVLTAAQKEQFDEMKGEPFEMPRPEFGRRGPGGRGSGGDRGGDRGRPRRPGGDN